MEKEKNGVAVIYNKDNSLKEQRSFTPEQQQLIKKTCAKDLRNDEFNLFIELCKRQNLDPFRKQVYAIVYNKDNEDKRNFSFITSIQGYRAIADRTGDYMPSGEKADVEIDKDLISDTNPQGLVSVTTYVKKLGKDGQYHSIPATAYWEEYAPISEKWEKNEKGRFAPTGVFYLQEGSWKKMPKLMLEKCAEAQALRRAFPEEIGSLYVKEEMDKAYSDDLASVVIDQYEEEERQRRINKSNGEITVMVDGSLEAITLGQFSDHILEKVSEIGSVKEIDDYLSSNRLAINEFWAKNKNEAIELKKKIEQFKECLKESENNG